MKTKELNFIEALRLNRDIKRKNWTKDIYVYANGNIYWEKGSLASLHKEDILATDWEIVEEPKKTLWDKRTDPLNLLKEGFSERAVKEALKEFIEFFGMKHTVYEAKLKEIFGEEFFKEIEKQ
jgi:hypothetical protein